MTRPRTKARLAWGALPNEKRGRPLVTITLSREALARLDKRRGKLPRGRFLEALIMAASLLFAGCMPAATHEPIMAPDGMRAMMVQCPGSRAACLQEAAAVCPRGYDILDQEAQTQANTNLFNGAVYTAYRGQMVVRCRREAE